MHQSLNLNPKNHFLRSRAITNLLAVTSPLLKEGIKVKTYFLFLISLLATSCAQYIDDDFIFLNQT